MSKDKLKLIYHTKGPKKGKLDKILHEDYAFFFWDYEEQTKIKHNVLREYLYVWATKLGALNSNIVYYDGFSGCGGYYELSSDKIGWGSPIIAKEEFSRANRDNKSVFYLNDKDQNNIENIKKILKYKNNGFGNVNFTLGEFENNINQFLNQLERKPVPTFFMIDPYGINVSFDTIKRILQIPKTEIFFNFMYNFPRRFTTNIKSENNLTNLFGTDNWKKYKNHSGDSKENALKSLYREQLKSCVKYVYQYRMSFPNDKRTYYYLFHATNNREGCSIMKDAFAKINFGNVEFLGPNQPNPLQLSLIDFNDEKIKSLKDIIWNDYKDKKIKYSDVIENYIDSTPYLQRHIRQAILSMKNEYLSINHEKINTRTVQDNDILEFFENPKIVEKSIQTTLF